MACAMVNGRMTTLDDAVIPATDVGFLRGWTVFETLRVVDGDIPLLREHLARLEASAATMFIPMPDGLAGEACQLAQRADGENRIRITLSGSGLRMLTLEPVERGRRGATVRCATGPFVADPFLDGSVKHGSRAGWVVAVRAAGVDDVLLVDRDGRFTEGTTCGVIAVVDGVVRTAPHDGRILPSTTVVEAVAAAERLGIPVAWRGAVAAGPLDGLYMASATRGLAPVVSLDGRVLPGWEPVGRRIFEAL